MQQRSFYLSFFLSLSLIHLFLHPVMVAICCNHERLKDAASQASALDKWPEIPALDKVHPSSKLSSVLPCCPSTLLSKRGEHMWDASLVGQFFKSAALPPDRNDSGRLEPPSRRSRSSCLQLPRSSEGPSVVIAHLYYMCSLTNRKSWKS